MKFCFIFYHGFGFDAHFWDNLRPFFSCEFCIYLDSGYFGAENIFDMKNESVKYIGIGHSLGLIKLMALNIPFYRLIGLQAFINFLGFNPTLRQQRQQEWEVFKQYLVTLPELCLRNFYSRCGVVVDNEKMKNLNMNRLMRDLDYLSMPAPISFLLANQAPLLIIGSKNDAIVPLKLIEDNFLSYPNVILDIQKSASHCLGYVQPDVVYQKIMDFAYKIE